MKSATAAAGPLEDPPGDVLRDAGAVVAHRDFHDPLGPLRLDAEVDPRADRVRLADEVRHVDDLGRRKVIGGGADRARVSAQRLGQVGGATGREARRLDVSHLRGGGVHALRGQVEVAEHAREDVAEVVRNARRDGQREVGVARVRRQFAEVHLLRDIDKLRADRVAPLVSDPCGDKEAGPDLSPAHANVQRNRRQPIADRSARNVCGELGELLRRHPCSRARPQQILGGLVQQRAQRFVHVTNAGRHLAADLRPDRHRHAHGLE